MPSLRLLSVAVLVGMGAVVAAAGGLSNAAHKAGPDADQSSAIRGDRLADAVGATPTPAATPFDVQAENQRPGTPGWRISPARGNAPGLKAYAGAISVLPGERVPLAVSSQGSVRVRALRIGWYGGVGARQVWQGSLHARREPADPAGWQARGWADTTGWPEGHYLLRLDQADVNPDGSTQRASRYLPLTVRSADSGGRILVLTSPLTWQVENATLTDTGELVDAQSGRRTASFDRPYTAGYGAGGFLADDEGIVQQAERSGRPLAYATDYDLATDPKLVSKASAVLIGGDSRFWPTSLRATIAKAADAGTNLAFFGAGTGSREVRLLNGGRALKVSSVETGGDAGDSVQLTGLRPSCPASSTPIAAGWTISDADWWGYRGTGQRTGDVVPGLVADRADRAATASADSPKALQVLSFTRMACEPLAADGSASSQIPGVQSAVYQVRPSGAAVFAAGVGRWACAVADTCVDETGKPVSIDKRTQRFVVRITRTVIDVFATARAGRRHPAKDSASQYAALR